MTHVLLDLDGTLSDSILGIGRVAPARILRVRLRNRRPTNRSDRSSARRSRSAFPHSGSPSTTIERVVEAYRERYEDVGLFENEMYPGIAEMLDELAGAGYTLSLADRQAADRPPSASSNTSGSPTASTVQAGATIDVGSQRRTKAEVITYALAELGIEADPEDWTT